MSQNNGLLTCDGMTSTRKGEEGGEVCPPSLKCMLLKLKCIIHSTNGKVVFPNRKQEH